MEERERNLYANQGRSEIMIQGLQRDVKYHEEKVREYDKKIRQLDHNTAKEIQLKERARLNLQVPCVLIRASDRAVESFLTGEITYRLICYRVQNARFLGISHIYLGRTSYGDWHTR